MKCRARVDSGTVHKPFWKTFWLDSNISRDRKGIHVVVVVVVVVYFAVQYGVLYFMRKNEQLPKILKTGLSAHFPSWAI